MNANNTLLITGVIGTGLVAGLLYGWAVSVIPGTTRVGDHTYVETMQDINRAIINPAFIVPSFRFRSRASQWQLHDFRTRTWTIPLSL